MSLPTARVVLLAAALAACDFTRRELGAGDAPELDVPDPDAPRADAADAAPLGPWGEPVLVTELSGSENDDDPTLTDDLLEVYFGTTRGAGPEDIWRATRATPASPWGAPMLVTELSSASLDSNVDISGDGLTIMFTSSRGGNDDIWFATRTSRSTAWSAPQLAPSLSSLGGDWGAALSADLLTAVLCSSRGALDEALYLATRPTPSDGFGTPAEITGVETTADECDAMMPDAETLYFTRNAVVGTPGLDIYVAERTGASTYGNARPLDTLNTLTSRDSDPWVSADQRTMYFSSNRTGGRGFDDIYMSTR